jgi:hypothetical protein
MGRSLAEMPDSSRSLTSGQPVELLTSFSGMSRDRQISLLGSDQSTSPPDTQIAASPIYVLEMVNASGSVWTKAGGLVATSDLNTFFPVPSGFYVGDPRVQYDLTTGRFFASALAVNSSNDSRVFVGVSLGANPSGAWSMLTFVSTSGILSDQPKLGLTSDKVVETWNDYSASGFRGQETWVFQKSDLVSGSSSVATSGFGPDPNRFNLVPAQDQAPGPTAYLIYNGNSLRGRPYAGPYAGIVSITGTPALNNVVWNETDPAIFATNVPPDAEQPGGSPRLDTGGDRFVASVSRNGTLWAAADDRCVFAADPTPRSCLRLIEISLSSSPLVLTDIDDGLAGGYVYYPALAADDSGNVMATFSQSSATTYAGVYAIWLQSTAPAVVNPETLLAPGMGRYDCGASCYTPAGAARWGDYSGAASDPTNPRDIWLAGEYAASSTDPSTWGTVIGRVTVSGPTVSSVSPASGPAAGGTTVVITGSEFVASGTTVYFGQTASLPPVVLSPESLQAVSPAHAGGPVDVTVVTAAGTSTTTAADQFVYAVLPPPVIASVTPRLGPVGGGTPVTITGTNLGGATQIRFGTVNAPILSNSGTEIATITPAATLSGVVDVRITASGGTSILSEADHFTYVSLYEVTSVGQYRLSGSDGLHWVDVDASRLSLMVTPPTDAIAVLSGNADLWTATAGVNQDMGIAITGGDYPTHAGQPEAWKESGGFAGTFSPNAAFVHGVTPLRAGTTYQIKLQWKSNVQTNGATIVAGAGPIGPDFSPTRLTVQLLAAAGTPLASPDLRSAAATAQFQLNGSDGDTWSDLGGAGAPSIQYTAPGDGKLLLTANADLWTAQAGFNQDLGIAVAGGAYPTYAGQPEVWKESGGFAGTFSPNAAFAQGSVSVSKGTTYTVRLQWKANKPAPASATIYAGAGPIDGRFSPTGLSVRFMAQAATLTEALSSAQLSLANSNGADWNPVDPGLNLTLMANANCLALLSGNADLWTATAGFNQDLAITVNGTVIAWKESGGFAGTFSPNAAFVQGTYVLSQGSNYSVQLQWKTNRDARPSGATIFAGAGPIGGRYSPTRLSAEIICS